jgi:hypothetical protein
LIWCVAKDFKALGALLSSMHWAKKLMHELQDESTMNPQAIVQGESIYTNLVLKIGGGPNFVH